MHDLSVPSACPTDLALDEWLAAELDEAGAARVEQHLASCARCAARARAFEREYAGFLQQAPSFDAHAALLGRSRAARRRAMHAARAVAGALVLCAFALLLWVPVPRSGTRQKGGGPHLGFFVKRGNRIHQGRSGELVRAGDQLRFTYSSARPRYLALHNRDRSGASVYYPAGGTAVRVAPGAEVALAFSVELDDDPGPERVYAVFCPTPFEVEPLREALASTPALPAKPLAALPAKPDCQVDVTELEKEAPR